MNNTGMPPLVQKALAEQAAIFTRLGESLPADLAAATTRTLQILDRHLPHDDRRDCIMTVAVLMHCPPYQALKSQRFAQDYHPLVQDMLDRHTQGQGVTSADTDLVQVYSAMFIVHADNLKRHVLAAAPDRRWLRDVRESLGDYAADREIYAAGILPPLRAEEDLLLSGTLAAIDQALAAASPKKKTGPRPPKR